MNFEMIKFMLGFANIPAAEVAELQTNAPALARLIQTSQEVKPIYDAAEPHIQALLPLYQQAQALYVQAAPHIQALIPLATQAMVKVKTEEGDVASVAPMLLSFVKDINAVAKTG
jgi:hypothetical protein